MNPMHLTAFLEKYRSEGKIRAHMPGHKGVAPAGAKNMENAYSWDITEIDGADSLFEASGILQKAEQQTAQCYGSGSCCWSAGGSTLCIQAMLARMRSENRTVVAARTVHRAFLNAAVLLGLEVEWVFPRRGGILSGDYAPEDFQARLSALQAAGQPACVYVTSPDYLGNLQDIAALSAICRAFDAPLLVDNAHGAHLAFLEQNLHPMALGADYCCDSAHKMLPALTGGAWLHCREAGQEMRMKQSMQLFGSTSPSYLILQSLECCTAFLQGEGAAAIRRAARMGMEIRQEFAGKYDFTGDDPLHLTIRAAGNDLADQLRAHGVECEHSDESHIVLLLSPSMTQEDARGLADALQACSPLPSVPVPVLPAPMECVCDMRTAALSPSEVIPTAQAEGRICAAVQVPCPPAVPIAVSGERLTAPWLRLMEYYGLRTVSVLQM